MIYLYSIPYPIISHHILIYDGIPFSFSIWSSANSSTSTRTTAPSHLSASTPRGSSHRNACRLRGDIRMTNKDCRTEIEKNVWDIKWNIQCMYILYYIALSQDMSSVNIRCSFTCFISQGVPAPTSDFICSFLIIPPII